MKTIEDALVSALRKNLGKTAQISAKIDTEAGSIKAFQTLTVVETVTNPETELDVEQAKAYTKNPKVGDVVTNTLDVKTFPALRRKLPNRCLSKKCAALNATTFIKNSNPAKAK